MTNERLKTSITLYGTLIERPEIWLQWYNYAKDLTERIGFKPTHYCALGESLRCGKIVSCNYDSRLIKLLKSEDLINEIEIYSLPAEFKQAAFDYHTLFVRGCGNKLHHVTLSIPSNVYAAQTNEIVHNIIEELKSFIKIDRGVIFEMSVLECPLLYAMKAKKSGFETLKVLRNI